MSSQVPFDRAAREVDDAAPGHPHPGPAESRGGPEAIRPDDIMMPSAGRLRPGDLPVASSVRAGESSTGPGLAGVFGAGTPLGEATGIRLGERRRWVACLLGLVLGFLGAQSFYTGRVLRGMFQLALVVSSGALALITLGLLAPLFQVVLLAVWLWGAGEGLAYLLARSGTYSRDVLGGRLV